MAHIKIEWAQGALESILRIYSFYADEMGLPDVAEAAYKKIYQGVAILASTPEAGRPAKDLEPEQRELFIKFGGSGFACVYEVWQEQGFILILHIKHQKEPGYHLPW